MVTRERALQNGVTEFHYTGRHACIQKIGPRGSIVYQITHVKRNGKTQTWKSDPSRFRIPVKYGLKEYGYIDESNCADYHTAADCPLSEPGAVRERELAKNKKHVGSILIQLSKGMSGKDRTMLFALSPEDKLTIATHEFPEAAAAILIHRHTKERSEEWNKLKRL